MTSPGAAATASPQPMSNNALIGMVLPTPASALVQAALVAALKSGRLAGAGHDVAFEHGAEHQLQRHE